MFIACYTFVISDLVVKHLVSPRLLQIYFRFYIFCYKYNFYFRVSYAVGQFVSLLCFKCLHFLLLLFFTCFYSFCFTVMFICCERISEFGNTIGIVLQSS